MGLTERIDAVCKARGWSDRAWSLKAGLSSQYIHTARVRAERDPSYRLPEKGAAALAAVAQVPTEWLRFGRGTMDTTTPTPSAEPRPDARAMFVQQLARSIADLAAAGDDDAARKASQLLTELLTDETPAQAPPRARSA